MVLLEDPLAQRAELLRPGVTQATWSLVPPHLWPPCCLVEAHPLMNHSTMASIMASIIFNSWGDRRVLQMPVVALPT